MKKTDNVKDILFAYVTDTNKWFYWYHSPKRLQALYNEDHEKEEDYTADDRYAFTKRVWRFKEKTVKNNEVDSVVIEENLADFFDAVLDEVRLKKANDFAEYALYISDNEDLSYFRNTAAKREIVADIDYNKQRDHAVHTLYNYLLGWYIFEHSEKLQEAFQNHFEKTLKIELDTQKNNLLRFYKNTERSKRIEIEIPDSDSLMGLVHEFADVWTIVSLLHDIGYILEGSLSSASPDVEHLRVTNGSKIIHDYFNHYFWKSFEVDFRAGKSIARTLDVVVPDFRYSESLSSLGDRLCDIGSGENIRNILSDITQYRDYKTCIPIQQQYGLNRDAFSIWKEHYKFHNNKQMENILYIVERVYKNMMWVGADYGTRNLDHGVCSGLIALQALTFFRELFWGFCQTKWSSEPFEDPEQSCFSKKQKRSSENICDRVSKDLFEKIKNEITRVPLRIIAKYEFGPNDGVFHKHCMLRPDFWFKKILWATASSAIHSIIQKKEYIKQYQKHLTKEDIRDLKIGYHDDPLAFLGVFVDVLQEWDRYKVTGRGEAAFSGDEPLQSTGVYLYPNKDGWINSLTKRSCPEKTIIDDLNKDSIYLTYPEGDNETKDWIKELTKTMDYGLKADRNTIVEIIAYKK